MVRKMSAIIHRSIFLTYRLLVCEPPLRSGTIRIMEQIVVGAIQLPNEPFTSKRRISAAVIILCVQLRLDIPEDGGTCSVLITKCIKILKRKIK